MLHVKTQLLLSVWHLSAWWNPFHAPQFRTLLPENLLKHIQKLFILLLIFFSLLHLSEYTKRIEPAKNTLKFQQIGNKQLEGSLWGNHSNQQPNSGLLSQTPELQFVLWPEFCTNPNKRRSGNHKPRTLTTRLSGNESSNKWWHGTNRRQRGEDQANKAGGPIRCIVRLSSKTTTSFSENKWPQRSRQSSFCSSK